MGKFLALLFAISLLAVALYAALSAVIPMGKWGAMLAVPILTVGITYLFTVDGKAINSADSFNRKKSQSIYA